MPPKKLSQDKPEPLFDDTDFADMVEDDQESWEGAYAPGIPVNEEAETERWTQ